MKGKDPGRPRLQLRPLLSPIQAGGMASLFKVLANDTRLRLLHALIRTGEVRVSELAGSLGMKPQAVSNQLQRLLDLGVLATRRDATSIYYRVVDPCVAGVLDLGWCLLEEGGRRGGVTERARACCQPADCCPAE